MYRNVVKDYNMLPHLMLHCKYCGSAMDAIRYFVHYTNFHEFVCKMANAILENSLEAELDNMSATVKLNTLVAEIKQLVAKIENFHR